MGTTKIIILILFLSSLFISCSDNSVVNNSTPIDTAAFKYPFNIGNTWNYTCTITLSDFKPDTIEKYLHNYPLTYSGTITILYDTSINGITTRCFCDVEQTSTGTRTYRNYYINNDTSLILYAYRGGPGSGNMPDNLNMNGLGSFKNNSFKMIQSSEANNNDTLYIYTDVVILKYPIHTGIEWRRYSNFNTYVDRKYLGFENVNVPAGTITCMKVQKIYSVLTDATLFDYYSKYGLMKRTTLYNDISISTPEYPEGIGTVDMFGNEEVTSYTVQ